MYVRQSIRQLTIATTLVVVFLCSQVTASAIEQAATVGGERHVSTEAVRAVDLKALPTVDAVIPRLAQKQVVFVGEIHDQYGHHLAQLEIIRRLHAIHDDLVIGVEYFQVPFQQALDAYIAGRLTEKQLLKQTEYFER